MATPTYPIKVELSGTDGNAFALIAKVREALRRHGVASVFVSDFVRDAYASESYDDLLLFLMETVDVE